MREQVRGFIGHEAQHSHNHRIYDRLMLVSFYRRDFHPWQNDNRVLIDVWTKNRSHPVLS